MIEKEELVAMEERSEMVAVNQGPTKAEIIAFEDRCKELEEDYKTLPPYVIAEGEKGLKLAKIAKTYNSELYTWRENEYQGVLFFDEFISALITEMESDETVPFSMDKNHLQWFYYILTNKATGGGMGTGIESAKLFKEHINDLQELLTAISEANNEFQKFMLRVKKAQEVLTAAYQGCYLKDDKIVTADEFYEESEYTNTHGEESCEECTCGDSPEQV